MESSLFNQSTPCVMLFPRFLVPLILIGNGIGAVVVRQITVSNIDNVKKYKYLKNGAMYSVAFLGVIMLMDSFGAHVPSYVSPVVTVLIIAYFFMKSKKELVKVTKSGSAGRSK